MRKVVAGGLGAAMVLAAGVAQAQLASPVIEWRPEFYVGGGGLYGSGVGRSMGGDLTVNTGSLGGLAPFAYVGVRLPFRGIFLGIEGEYDFSRRSHAVSISDPGFANPPFNNGVGIVDIGVLNARTTGYQASISDRAAALATVFFPFGGVELFGKIGVAYTELKETFAISYTSPVSASVSIVCPPGPIFNPASCSNVIGRSFAQNIAVDAKQNVFAPVLGAGVQIPFGGFFVRLEGQADFANYKTTVFTYRQLVTENVGLSSQRVTSFVASAAANPIGGADGRIMLSVGYKW